VDPAAGAVELLVAGQPAGAVDLLGLRVAGEAGDVDVALVEQGLVGRAGGPALARVVGALADELVDVVEALVVAGVGDDPAVLRDADRGALVLEAAQRRPLDRDRLRVVRVELDDPAEPVDLVGLLRQVEAPVDLVPPASRQVARRYPVPREARFPSGPR
jgi:hypothetical protein